MAGYKELINLKKDAIFINASRGAVVNSYDLFAVLTQRPDLKVWLDVFEGEPEIKCHELFDYIEGATPHIAGYSYESKIRASLMLAKMLSDTLKLDVLNNYQIASPEIGVMVLGNIETADLDLISRLVFSVYDVRRDSSAFMNRFTDGKSFDMMRKNYRERRELSSVNLVNVPESMVEKFSLLGFNAITRDLAIKTAKDAFSNQD